MGTGVAGVLLLAGCGNSTNPDVNNTGSASSDKVVVDVFNIKVETRDQMERLVAQYESLHPEVEINVQTIGGGADSCAALQARFAAGEAPSIWMIGGLAELELWQDHLLDISNTKAASQAIEGTLDGATLNGVQYGLPFNIEGFAWLYNKDVFERAGINVEDIKSYADFEQMVAKLDSEKERLGLDAVFAFSGAEDWVWGQYSSHFTSVAYDNDVFAVANAQDIDWGVAESFMKGYTDLIRDYGFSPVITVDYSMAIEDLFVNDRVAMTHQGNWVVPTLDGINPSFANEKLGILPFFIENNGSRGTIAAGPSWFWAVNSQKEEAVIQASIDFLDWMYTSEEGMYALINDFGFIPAYYGNNIEDITDPVSKQIYEMLEGGEVTPWIHNSYPAGFSSNTMAPEFQRYVAGQSSWDDFIEISQGAWQQARR